MKLKRNEKVEEVKGYEGMYAITTLGRVWSYRKKKWLSPWADIYGYSRITFRKDSFEKDMRVHKLVGEAFLDNHDNKPQINHINGKKWDNKLKNLEYCTAKENMQHAHKMGLTSSCKLSKSDREMICQFHLTFDIGLSKLAKMFDVSPTTIHYTLKTHTPFEGHA